MYKAHPIVTGPANQAMTPDRWIATVSAMIIRELVATQSQYPDVDYFECDSKCDVGETQFYDEYLISDLSTRE